MGSNRHRLFASRTHHRVQYLVEKPAIECFFRAHAAVVNKILRARQPIWRPVKMELNSRSRATIFWPRRDSQPDAPTSALLPRLDANDEKARFTQTTVMNHLASGSGRLLCCFMCSTPCRPRTLFQQQWASLRGEQHSHSRRQYSLSPLIKSSFCF
jgi:hypothetical protein